MDTGYPFRRSMMKKTPAAPAKKMSAYKPIAEKTFTPKTKTPLKRKNPGFRQYGDPGYKPSNGIGVGY